MWNFKAYESPAAKNDVQSTFDSGTDSLQAGLIAAIEYLGIRQKHEWTNPRQYAAKLVKGTGYKDYYEIRFKADSKQQRPIGYFGPGSNDFTVLIWAEEKGGKLVPDTWRDKADHRRQQIESGEAHAKPLRLDII